MDCFPVSTTAATLSVLQIFITCTFLFFQFKRGTFLTFSSAVFERSLLRECCLWSMLVDMLLNIEFCSYDTGYLCKEIFGHGPVCDVLSSSTCID